MTGEVVSFRILGALEAWAGDTLVALRGPRQERCLAALLLEPGRLVTFDGLVDATWDDPPPTARRQVQDLVAGLRRVMIGHGGRDDLITTRRSGYVLRVDPAELDSLRFEQLVAAARRDAVADPRGAAATLRSALALCRGSVLAGIDSRALEPATARWEEFRRAVREDWLALELGLGNVGIAVSGLAELVTAYPLRERPAELLMRALHATGRTSEALEVYHGLRRRLAEEVGLDPGAAIQELQRMMLSGEAIEDWAAADQVTLAASPLTPGPLVPAQLPADVRAFAGRAAELERLDTIALASGQRPTAVVIAAVAGTAGIGKTALAVHWAHRVAGWFPDGQLYVNLRGFDPGQSQMHPAEAVRGLLDALHVLPARVPTTFDAQVGLYRSLLAGKRMLVVLDNARDGKQVRPLLPGAPGCMAVVTSRDQLAGLVTVEGAHSITLDLLTQAEARQLLSHRLGEPVVRSDPDAVNAIITSCERLPLALAIVAARAALHPGVPLVDLAARLRRTQAGLDAFAIGDPNTDLRSVFSWSYGSLSADAARVLRLLGLHPGPDFAVPAVASLAGITVSRAQSLLVELGQAHLVVERAPGRFSFHDLLRAYAAELVHAVDTEPDREAATVRLLDHYLHTARSAAMHLRPSRSSITLPVPLDGVIARPLVDLRHARAWFADEYRCVLAAVLKAAEQGYPVHAWRLAWTLEDVLDRGSQWHELAVAENTALRAAEQQDDLEGQASAYSGLARAYWRRGEFDRAHTFALTASEIYLQLGDRGRHAAMFRNLCAVRMWEGRYAEALAYAERGLDVLPADIAVEELAQMLNAAGQTHAYLGNYQQALTYCERALGVQQGSIDGPMLEGSIVDTLGYIHHHLGHVDEAINCYQRSARLIKEGGDAYIAARVLVRLGETYHAAGQLDDAVQVWRQALETFDRLDPSTATSLRDRLSQLNHGDE